MTNIKQKKEKTTNIYNSLKDLYSYLNDNLTTINNSKMFAGLMIIILNVSSKFVDIKLSKTMESYLKHTFSRDILVFAIAWMGTREIIIAFFITIIFKIFFDYLLNEKSLWCCLPTNFTEYHISLLENTDKVSEMDIKKAKEVLEKARIQNQNQNNDNQNKNIENINKFPFPYQY